MRFYSASGFLAHVAQHGTKFGGSLYLQGCTGLTALPDNLSVGGSLDLQGCTGLTILPDNLSVGGSLYLQGCTGLTKAIYDCGKNNRTILPYNHPTRGRVISLGCFIGNKDEAIEAVKEKYIGQDALDYIAKIEQAFA